MVAGREWQPGATAFLATSLTMGLAALLRRLQEGPADLDSEWRRLVTVLAGLMAQTQGTAALATLEG
eukprot:7619166-Alexandrium_andersonii.AAC.1